MQCASNNISDLLPKHDENSIGLIGHTIINYPTPELAESAVDVMVENGVNLIELQIPFTEPVADGPVFTKANHGALASGVHVADCFAFMHKVTAKHDIPFVFTAYANTLFNKGYANFISEAKAAGARGAIVPDLPVDNAADYLAICQEQDFAPIQLIPPNTADDRMREIAEAAGGFIYAVARGGVSGDETTYSEQLKVFLAHIRTVTDLPIAVGFGVKQPSDVEFLKPFADYAIVGTAAFKILQEQGIDKLREFWQNLKAVTA